MYVFTYMNGLSVNKNEMYFSNKGGFIYFSQDGDAIPTESFLHIYDTTSNKYVYRNKKAFDLLTYPEFVDKYGKQANTEYREALLKKTQEVIDKYDKSYEDISATVRHEYETKLVALQKKEEDLVNKYSEYDIKCENKLKEYEKDYREKRDGLDKYKQGIEKSLKEQYTKKEEKMLKEYSERIRNTSELENKYTRRCEEYDDKLKNINREIKDGVRAELKSYNADFSYCYICKFSELFKILKGLSSFKKGILKKLIGIDIDKY